MFFFSLNAMTLKSGSVAKGDVRDVFKAEAPMTRRDWYAAAILVAFAAGMVALYLVGAGLI